MADPIPMKAVSRRTVLKGIAGTAGLVTVPAIIAACSDAGSSSAPAGSPASAAPTAAESAVATGSISFGSNYSDEVPKNAMQQMVDAFTAETGIDVAVNTVEHGTFQDQISSYLQGTPDNVFTWFSGFRMRFFAAQGLAEPITDVWGTVGSNYSEAFKVGSTGDDGEQYFLPIYNYPWAVFYRKSLFEENGYTPPANLDEFKTLAARMQSDGLVPMAFGDSDGWPAMGTFDIINLRQNGYDFHVGLMAGTEKWTDDRTKQVFTVWKDLLPFYQEGAAGRTWQDAAQALVQKQAGMYLLGMFVSEQFVAAGAGEVDDLDFFPYPNFGTQYDGEKALDAPIDGFMLAKNSPTLGANLDGAKAFMEFMSKGSTQNIYTAANPGVVAAANDADPSGYNALQQKAVELISGAQRITQFLDRDTNPNFAGPNGMQAFLLDFIQNRDQDLNAFTQKIQDFWDTL
ncbi:MAG: ABC transporter substrate-binding protein [Chloroflexota bacterium]